MRHLTLIQADSLKGVASTRPKLFVELREHNSNAVGKSVDMERTSKKQNRCILKKGYLLKKSELLKKWNLRYFVLSKECLCYYESELKSNEDAPKELIFFNDMSVYIDELPGKHTKYCIKIVKKPLSSKVTPRAYTVCCFTEEERNEWLAQILLAKAMALVMDPAWVGNSESPSDISNLERSKSAPESYFTSARDVIQKCRRKLTLKGSLRHSPSCTSFSDLNANMNLSVNSHWKGTLTSISAGTA